MTTNNVPGGRVIPPALLDYWRKTACCLHCGKRFENLSIFTQHLAWCR